VFDDEKFASRLRRSDSAVQAGCGHGT